MRLVIADTGPVNYPILIGHIELLPRLCERVVLPDAVQAELSSPGAPPPVQHWIATPPFGLRSPKRLPQGLPKESIPARLRLSL